MGCLLQEHFGCDLERLQGTRWAAPSHSSWEGLLCTSPVCQYSVSDWTWGKTQSDGNGFIVKSHLPLVLPPTCAQLTSAPAPMLWSHSSSAAFFISGCYLVLFTRVLCKLLPKHSWAQLPTKALGKQRLGFLVPASRSEGCPSILAVWPKIPILQLEPNPPCHTRKFYRKNITKE